MVDKNRNIYASLNQYHNTNNKCIFTKLNAVFKLSHFYMDARTKSGDLYKATTLTNTRHALNRYLKSPPYLKKIDRENISGHMPEDREMPEYCPVRNFETYLQKLHPQCNRLWQFPKDSFNISDECWFQKRPIGKDTLASFMSTLS